MADYCETPYSNLPFVCGTDGRTYRTEYSLECEQRREYGKRVNLQMRHENGCWIWEKHGINTLTLGCAVLIVIVFLGACYRILRVKCRASRQEEIPFERIISA